jgi:hypothetical protein
MVAEKPSGKHGGEEVDGEDSGLKQMRASADISLLGYDFGAILSKCEEILWRE